jgi:hypothetical protein
VLYRLKCGSHHDGKKFYEEGSLIDTSIDLLKLDPVKFEEVSRRLPEMRGESPRGYEGISLEDLTMDELKLLAKEERVDVSGAESRADLLEVLRVVLD